MAPNQSELAQKAATHHFPTGLADARQNQRSHAQDLFLAATVANPGATRMEQLVAYTTQQAARLTESREVASRIGEWGISTLAAVPLNGPVGVVLGTLAGHCADTSRSTSNGKIITQPFLDKIATDQDSTPLEKTVASTIKQAVRAIPDTYAAAKSQELGLSWLASGAKGSTGQVLGEIGVFARTDNVLAKQTLLERVVCDAGSTSAERAIAQQALNSPKDVLNGVDGALLKLYHSRPTEVKS